MPVQLFEPVDQSPGQLARIRPRSARGRQRDIGRPVAVFTVRRLFQTNFIGRGQTLIDRRSAQPGNQQISNHTTLHATKAQAYPRTLESFFTPS